MNAMNQTIEQPSDREFVMTRVFDAPRDLMWQAWSDCKHLVHWWGPQGWTLPVCKMDFRPGGVWHYCMSGSGPDGKEMESWGRAVYQEIIEPERIIYADTFSDEAGNVVEDMPEILITLTFEEIDGKTKLTNRAQFASAADLQNVLDMGMEQGATETWDRLETYIQREKMQPYPVLETLYHHHLWANLQLLEVCASLSDEQLQTSIIGVYGSIGDTLQHLVRAERSYFSRISTGQRYDYPEDAPPLTFADMAETLKQSGEGLIEWAPKVQATDTVEIQWNNGSINKLLQVPKAVILTQVINHATEHRSQIMAILTQLGIEPPELSSWAYFEAQELKQ